MTSDRRICRVRQSELLKPGKAATRRHLIGRDDGKESVPQDGVEILASKLPTDRATDQARAFAEDGYRVGTLPSLREQRFLRDAALVPQRVQLPRIQMVPLFHEALLHDTCEREIHVVATEQNVIADCDTLQRKVAGVLSDQDQTEIGRPPADVAHEEQIAHAKFLAPEVARTRDPRIAGGLRLLEQSDARKTGLGRGAKRQLAGLFVERCRNGDEDLLSIKREDAIPRREPAVPCRGACRSNLRQYRLCP